MSRTAFSGDVNTQNHTWTSGLPFLVIIIVFFVAFLWMRCLPPSLSLVVHIFWLSICVTTGSIGVPDSGPVPREFCLCNSHRRQHGWTCNCCLWPGVARSVNLALCRKTIALFSCPSPECGWLLASATSSEGRKVQFVVSFTWCLCPFVTVIPSVMRA